MQLDAVRARATPSHHGFQQLPAGDAGLLGGLHAVASMTRRDRNQQIAKQDKGLECWYQIVRGAARHCASHYDGQRQIIDFLLPGDMFVEAKVYEHFAVEAIVDYTIVASFPACDVERRAGTDPRLADDFRDVTMAGAHRLQRQILILGRASAIGKVSAFLLDMAGRLSNGTACKFDLPMSRNDIADYLVMSVETVSRSLTSLRSCGAIQFIGRRGVKIVDRSALEDAGENAYLA